MNFPKLHLIKKFHTKIEDCNTFFSNIKKEKKDFLTPLNLDGTKSSLDDTQKNCSVTRFFVL